VVSDTSIDWAMQDILYLEREHLITAEMARRGRELVDLIFQPSSVFASIGPIDDGDLAFYWVAGERSITADLFAEGGGWYRARNGLDTKTHEGETPDWLRDALAEFSAYVEAANTAWRLLRTVETSGRVP